MFNEITLVTKNKPFKLCFKKKLEPNLVIFYKYTSPNKTKENVYCPYKRVESIKKDNLFPYKLFIKL